MKLSDQRTNELYEAISDPVTKGRLVIMRAREHIGLEDAEVLDDMMCDIERDIWKNVRDVLKLP